MDDALKKVTTQNHSVKTVLVYDHKLAVQRESVPFVDGRDVWWQDAVAEHSTQCDIEWMSTEDPLFKVCLLARASAASITGLRALFPICMPLRVS